MKYLYNSRKHNRCFHILDENQRTYCLIENSSAFRLLDTVVDHPPYDRPACSTCENNKATRERKAAKRAAAKHRSEKSPNSTKKTEGFYSSWEWQRARYETLKKWGAVCMCCGSTERIVVDHIKPVSRYPDLRLDHDNLQVLCGPCNRGKSNWDETDWRPKLTPGDRADEEILTEQPWLKDILGEVK